MLILHNHLFSERAGCELFGRHSRIVSQQERLLLLLEVRDPKTPQREEPRVSEVQRFAHPEFLVETDWLAAHLDDPNLIPRAGTGHLIHHPNITYTSKSRREDDEQD